MNIYCVKCCHIFNLPSEGEGHLTCPNCNFPYEYKKEFLCYNNDILLYNNFKKKYLLNKVLNNNAYLGYLYLKEGSLSLPVRKDVANFRNFILNYTSPGKLLDIGCGILEIPGYIDFDDKSFYEFYGIDPISDSSFRGFRVKGCSEFTPFETSFFDTIIFATSLDHVCSLKKTISESYRILKPGGKVIVWMSDYAENITRLIKRYILNWINIFKNGFYSRHFVIYPNYTVFYIPNGGVDPFHSHFENPDKMILSFEKAGFVHIKTDYVNRDQVFICFQKKIKRYR